jgi:hypothetical protein
MSIQLRIGNKYASRVRKHNYLVSPPETYLSVILVNIRPKLINIKFHELLHADRYGRAERCILVTFAVRTNLILVTLLQWMAYYSNNTGHLAFRTPYVFSPLHSNTGSTYDMLRVQTVRQTNENRSHYNHLTSDKVNYISLNVRSPLFCILRNGITLVRQQRTNHISSRANPTDRREVNISMSPHFEVFPATRKIKHRNYH